jgi:hypothetical protein
MLRWRYGHNESGGHNELGWIGGQNCVWRMNWVSRFLDS